MSLLYAYKETGYTTDITILDADGDSITPDSNDKVKAIIYRTGETAKLTVTSGTPTTNGSSITIGAVQRLRLDASDLDFEAGVYTLEILFYDYSDSQELKMVSKQVFCLEDS